jgi:hypothetical protein
MKHIKFSKTGWLLLAAGVFIVALAILGLAFSRQNQSQAALNQELDLSQSRYAKLNNAELQAEYDVLLDQLETERARMADAEAKMYQNIESANITDEFFLIANDCGVRVVGVTTTPFAEKAVENIDGFTITLSGMVTGELDELIDFVISLNEGYPTGYVASARVVLPEPPEDDPPSLSVELILYSYEGS